MDDAYFMKLALYEAESAARKGEVPVGAVLVSGDEVVSSGHNECINRHDPTAHAEIVTLRKAGELRQNYRLPDCDLYVTLEPCVMCLGALVHARIQRLVFGAFDPKAGAVQSSLIFPFEKTNHLIEIKSGILSEDCGKILKDFFQSKRSTEKT